MSAPYLRPVDMPAVVCHKCSAVLAGGTFPPTYMSCGSCLRKSTRPFIRRRSLRRRVAAWFTETWPEILIVSGLAILVMVGVFLAGMVR